MTTTAPENIAEAPPIPAERRPGDLSSHWSAGVIGAAEDQGWIQALDGPLQRAHDAVLAAAPRLGDLLTGGWLGHALHPVLSDVPIGFFMSSLLLDLAGESRAAGTCTAAGAAASVATAASGVADWSGTVGRDRRLGLAHGLVNVAGLGVQLASLGARAGGRRKTALLLNAVGFAATSAAAYGGGELVLGRGIGVDHTVFTGGPAEWTDVAGIDDLPAGSTRAVEVEGRKVLLHRDHEGVHAMENTCTHAGGPLDEGEIAHGRVTCPWHGSCFSLRDGAVVNGPAAFPQPRLQARVRAGRIEVRGPAEE